MRHQHQLVIRQIGHASRVEEDSAGILRAGATPCKGIANPLALCSFSAKPLADALAAAPVSNATAIME